MSLEPVLHSAVSRILPLEGGGEESLSAAGFVAAALETPFFEGLAPFMNRGLALLEELAVERFGRGFSVCSESQQDALLEAIQAERENRDGFAAHWFFELLIILSLEGFLGHPRHGGNRNGSGWKFIGYEGPGHC